MPSAFERFHGHDSHALLFGIVKDVCQLGPVLKIIGDHDDIKTVRINRVTHDLLQPGRMRRHAQKAQLALFLEPIKCFMDIGVHQSVNGITGVDMGQVEIVGADPLQAGFNCCDHTFNWRVIAEMTTWRTKLRHNKQVVARMTFYAFSQRAF